mmetsp:Transcript_38112/g.68075  ORF Transcript_38112/g.68075 Transcript_38112/m.68075 type:complete len:212 (-) Transcript_38112:426-1061(-)
MPALPSRSTTWVKPLRSAEASANDDMDPHALRKIETQAIVPRVVFGSVLAVVFFNIGAPWSGVAVSCLVLANLIALPFLWLTNKTDLARQLAFNGTCLCHMATLWTLGGGPGACGTISSNYMEQIQHRVQVPSSRGCLGWVIATLLFSLTMAILERTADSIWPQQSTIPEPLYSICFFFCFNWPGFFLYIIVSQLIDQRLQSHELLEKSRM